MHDFTVKKNNLYCESVPVADIAARVGTPVYIYSRRTIQQHFLKLQQAFASVEAMICYSVKANSNVRILRLLADLGAGMDIVSGGELYRARKAGVAPDRIVYASVGKTAPEIEEALRAGIGFFNIESLPELEVINRVAARLNRRARVAVRVNPDVDAGTHHYITTAKKQNKFGVDAATAADIIGKRAAAFSHVDVRGLHMHLGSQIEQVRPYVQALQKITALAADLNRRGAALTHLNIGGGLGIIYNREKPQTAAQFAAAVLPLLRRSGLRVILEPGRFIVGNAGILLTRVLYVKHAAAKRFVIVDAAMNDLLRPALYGAYHDIIPLPCRPVRRVKTDVVGPVCESGDFLARDRLLPQSIAAETLLAVMSAGAYGLSMSSNYNSRRRAAEVLVDGTSFSIIRKRETYTDLVRNEITAEE